MNTENFETESLDDIIFQKTEEAENAVEIDNPMRQYLKDIGDAPILTKEEEIDLAKRIEAGKYAKESNEILKERLEHGNDAREMLRIEIESNNQKIKDGEDARQELIRRNLRLVVSLSKSYIGKRLTILDLIQEGNIGLMRATQTFDYRKGYKFSTYAVWWIKQYMSRALADTDNTIRLPVHITDLNNRIRRAQKELQAKLGRDATVEEIAKCIEETPERIREILFLNKDVVSLDMPIGEEKDNSLGDLTADMGAADPQDVTIQKTLCDEIEQILSTFPKRERDIIIKRFGLHGKKPRTLDEIGREYDLTRERIRQLEAKALKRFRSPRNMRRLQDYVSA